MNKFNQLIYNIPMNYHSPNHLGVNQVRLDHRIIGFRLQIKILYNFKEILDSQIM
jgi:hypothetical protein